MIFQELTTLRTLIISFNLHSELMRLVVLLCPLDLKMQVAQVSLLVRTDLELSPKLVYHQSLCQDTAFVA